MLFCVRHCPWAHPGRETRINITVHRLSDVLNLLTLEEDADSSTRQAATRRHDLFLSSNCEGCEYGLMEVRLVWALLLCKRHALATISLFDVFVHFGACDPEWTGHSPVY